MVTGSPALLRALIGQNELALWCLGQPERASTTRGWLREQADGWRAELEAAHAAAQAKKD